MSNKKNYSTLILLVLGCFFGFIFITKLSVGQHYDQLRYIISPEQQLLGLSENYSWRQLVANLLLFAYPATYLAEYLRFIGAFSLLPIIPRAVTALFFIASLLVWKSILRELRFSVTGGWFFLLLVVTSAWFIVFGKFIPLLGGYLLFTSLCWLYFIKWVERKRLLDLLASLVFLIFTTFTHVFGAMLLPLSLLVYLWLSMRRRHISVATVIGAGGWVFALVLLIAGTTIGVLSLTGVSQEIPKLQVEDVSLTGKNASTVLYQISHGDYWSAISSYGKRTLYYLHPSFLVIGGRLLDSPDDTSFGYNEIKNPEFNHWLITGIGPFGLISVVVFFLPTFIRLPKDSKGSFFWAMFIPYLLGAGIPNFDNPSIARFVPFLLWVPYVIVLYAEALVQAGLEKRKNAITLFLIVIGALVSSIYTLGYAYSDTYQRAEMSKFETAYDDAFAYLGKHVSPMPDVYYFQDPRWNSHSYLEYYLSPGVLGKTVLIEDKVSVESVVLTQKLNFVFLFKDKTYLEVFYGKKDITTKVIRDVVTGAEQYVAYSADLEVKSPTSCIYVDNAIPEIINRHVDWMGEEEHLTNGVVPRYLGSIYRLRTANTGSQNDEFQYLPANNMNKDIGLQRISIENASETDNRVTFTPGNKAALAEYSFEAESTGVFDLTFNYDANEYVLGEVLLLQGTTRIANAKFQVKTGIHRYESRVILPKSGEYTVKIIVYQFSPVPVKVQPKGLLKLTNLKVAYLGESEAGDYLSYAGSRQVKMAENRSVKIDSSMQRGNLVCPLIAGATTVVDGGTIESGTSGNLSGATSIKGSEVTFRSVGLLYVFLSVNSYLLVGIVVVLVFRFAERISE